MPILLLKHNIRLSNILWYQFHRATYCYSIYYYTENQITKKEIEPNGQKPAKDVTYMHHSLKNIFQIRMDAEYAQNFSHSETFLVQKICTKTANFPKTTWHVAGKQLPLVPIIPIGIERKK